MREKIGILFPTIDHSQRVYEFTMSAHRLLDQYSNVDIVSFYESINNPFIVQKFGSAHVSSMLSFNGTLIATDAKSARRISGVITSKRKVFYVMDLEWKTTPPLPYEFLAGVYRDPSLEVVARSESHAWALSNGFNINPPIVKDFNLELLCLKQNTSSQENIYTNNT